MSDQSTEPAVECLPRRRPIDAAFLSMARGAHVELSRQAPTRAPLRGGPASHAVVAMVAVFLILTSAGAATAMSAGSDPAGRPAPPCAPIHYRVNPDGSPTGGLATVHEAFRRLSDATGRAAVFDGLTADEPPAPWMLSKAKPRPVVVAWIAPEELAQWSDRHDSLGFAVSHIDDAGAVVSGSVSLNRDAELGPGFADRRSWGGVLLHEVGHIVGLAHSPDRSDLMFPDVIDGAAAWGPVDRMRLAEVGARAGC